MRRRRCTAIAILALVAASWAAPSAARGLTTPTIAVAAHRPDHGTGTMVGIDTLVHLQVVVRHNGQPIPGKVLIVFFEGYGCTGFSYAGEAVDLVNGEIDGARPYSLPEPAGGSFGARYLGFGEWGAVSAPCVDVTWKAPLDALTSQLHDRSHRALESVVGVGTEAHMVATAIGSWGAPDGLVTIYRYANGTCSGSGTYHQSWTPDIGGMLEVFVENHRYTAPGSYAWQAYFNNSETYLVKTGTCHALTVKATPTATVGIVDAAGAPLAQLAAGSQYYVRVAASGAFGTPTGRGAINFHTQANCGGLAFPEGLTLSDGKLVVGPKLAQAAGYPSLRFSYYGDGTYFGALSACVNLNVVATPSNAPTSGPSAPPSQPPSAPPTSRPTTNPTATSPSTGATQPTGEPSTAPAPATSAPGVPTAEGSAGTSGAPVESPGLATAEATTPVDAPSGALPPPTEEAGAPASTPGGGAPAGEVLVLILGVALLALLAGFAGALLVTRRRPASRLPRPGDHRPS